MTSHERVLQIGDTSLYSGTVCMEIPSGGAIQRHLELRLPLFSDQPDITATVFSLESPGPSFAVFSVQVNTLEITPSESVTQIVIDAQSADNSTDVEYKYWCTYMVIGKPA